MKNIDSKKIEELLSRGVEQIINRDHLRKKLLLGEVLRVKHGIDPTGPNIHIGRAAQFLKLKDFQELGHKIVLIIGDFTAQIGDASDKQAMRRPLTEKDIKTNMSSYLKQISKILNVEKIELHYNSEWLKKLTAGELLDLSVKFTAQQMIQRRNFKERWEGGKPIGLHELNYPLLQGLDSVKVKADIELGGFDQLFNLNTGRDIQKIFNQEPQDIMTLKMLSGLDGRKMSTSWGNVININDSPNEQFGKVMSLRDDLILDYLELCTRIPLTEIESLSPRDAKAKLAKEIVKIYHGEKAEESAGAEFNRVFKEKQAPSDIPEVEIQEKTLNILDLLVKANLCSSKSEAQRLVEQGGVEINEEIKKDWREQIEIKRGQIIRAGKRKFVKIA
ncbi:MAG: tyrosine--tRNA ligase [Candidatus Nealsonbacteria bacterium]|nr:tyrosine--tRNA ligase [Candidatus Nealsonbacteria bacterium]